MSMIQVKLSNPTCKYMQMIPVRSSSITKFPKYKIQLNKDFINIWHDMIGLLTINSVHYRKQSQGLF